MPKIDLYWREGGQSYKDRTTIVGLWDGSGAGFTFYPVNGPRIRCMVRNDSDIVINRDTGEAMGEYNQTGHYAVLVLGDQA